MYNFEKRESLKTEISRKLITRLMEIEGGSAQKSERETLLWVCDLIIQVEEPVEYGSTPRFVDPNGFDTTITC